MDTRELTAEELERRELYGIRIQAPPGEHERCGRCSRRLKDTKARAAGFGKVCLAKMKEATK